LRKNWLNQKCFLQICLVFSWLSLMASCHILFHEAMNHTKVIYFEYDIFVLLLYSFTIDNIWINEKRFWRFNILNCLVTQKRVKRGRRMQRHQMVWKKETIKKANSNFFSPRKNHFVKEGKKHCIVTFSLHFNFVFNQRK